MGNICCVTGHRPSSFPWNFWDADSIPRQKYLQVMASAIDHAIREDGIDHFIAGGAIGADTDFAETVLHYRDCIHEHIRLEIAVPCPNQNLKWTEQDKERYRRILDSADLVTTVSDRYTRFCMQKRNEYMVDNSDIVFAFWNNTIAKGGTWNTIQYAKKKQKRIELFVLNDYI